MKKTIFLILIFILLFCTSIAIYFLVNNTNSIIGTWENTNLNNQNRFIQFDKKDNLAILDEDKKNIFSKEMINAIKYEVIDEVNPKQIYLLINSENKNIREPFGIYKIENNKLIFRSAITYNNYIGFVDAGYSRSEFPKDFNGKLEVYKRIK